MDQPIHLVLVTGCAASQNNGSPKTFFSQLFPRALIDEFPFLDPSSIGWQLHQRAHALLEQLWKTRTGSKPMPIIFLAHGLGGFVVKQALVSVVEEPQYRDFALHVSAVHFFGVPHGESIDLTWEDLYLRLRSALPRVSKPPIMLTKRLIGEFEDVSRSFRTLPCGIDIINYCEGAESPLIDERCYVIGRSFSYGVQHHELWHFATERAAAEEVLRQIIIVMRTTDNLPLREFLHTLSILDPQTHRLHPTLLAAGIPDYATWHTMVTAWKSDPAVNILYISGDSGSGVTNFASQVLSDLLENRELQNKTVLSFVFNKSNPRARTLFSLLLSLCRQLVSFQSQLFQRVSSVASLWIGNGCLTTERLWIILRSMVAGLAEKEILVYCIICSIDECGSLPSEVVQRLEELVKTGNGLFKLLYTKKNSEQNVLGMKPESCLSIILDDTSQDIGQWKKRYIQSRIQGLAKENASWDGLSELALVLAEEQQTDPPYLLLKVNMILLEWITKGYTRIQLKEELRKHPNSLQSCYEEVIHTIKDDCRPWVLTALRWIAYAVRPMAPAELAVAVALSGILGKAQRFRSGTSNDTFEIHDMIQKDIFGDLRSCMAPLIKLENNQISFIHSTFKEYIKNLNFDASQSEEWEGSGDNENYQILSRCLEYLEHMGNLALTSTGDSDSRRLLLMGHEHGLLTYATLYWAEHFLKVESHEAAQERVLQFLKDDKQLSNWSVLYETLNPSLRRGSVSLNSPLRIICRFGLSCFVDDSTELAGLIQLEADLGQEKSKSLDLAVEYRHLDIVETLLGIGIKSKDALGLAAAGGSCDIVERILDIDLEGINRPDQSRYAPIHHATCAGHKDIVSLLLGRNADPDSRTTKAERDAEPLPLSSEVDSDTDSDVDSDVDSKLQRSRQSKLTDAIPTSVWHETSLQLAARTGQVEVIELLLSKNADLHAVNSMGYDALKYAAIGGFVDVVALFLAKGADRDKPSEADGNTALHLAAAHGHVKVVELLIQQAGAESVSIRMKNTRGLTPIHLAAWEGHLDVLNSIFGFMDRFQREGGETSTGGGLWIPPNDDGGKSALELAIEKGHCHIVLALLGRNVEKHLHKAARDGRGNTALHIAAKRGHSRTIEEILYNRNCTELFSVNSPNRNQMALLHLAAKAGHAYVVKVLLHYGADPSLQDGKGWTALHHAARRGHMKCVNNLEHKSNTSIADENGMTALHLAAKHGHAAVVRSIATDCDVNAVDNAGNSPLHIALHLDVVHELLRAEAKNDEKNYKGETPSYLAALHGRADTLRVLLDSNPKPDLKTVDNHKWTLLHAAYKHEHIVTMLLERGVNLDAQDVDGKTPLSVALQAGYYETAKTLIHAGANLNGLAGFGNSPLNCALLADNENLLEMVRTLVEKGADLMQESKYGGTALQLAVNRDKKDIVEYIIDTVYATGQEQKSGDMFNVALCECVSASKFNAEIASKLVARGLDINKSTRHGRNALHAACVFGTVDAVKWLLSQKADINAMGSEYGTALCATIESRAYKDEKIVLLLGHEPKVKIDLSNTDQHTPLQRAVLKDDIPVVELLLMHGANVNLMRPGYDTLLNEAISKHGAQVDTIDLLLKHVADIHKPGVTGKSPFHITAISSRRKVMQRLFKFSGASTTKDDNGFRQLTYGLQNTKVSTVKFPLARKACFGDDNGISALMYGILNGKASIVGYLLSQDAYRLDEVDPKGQTPLMMAAILGGETNLHMLLGSPFKESHILNAQDVHGKSALTYAVQHDHLKIVEMLIENGADPSITDCRGCSPLYWALRMGNREIIEAIIGATERHEGDKTDLWNIALHGAIICFNRGVIERLLDKDVVDARFSRPDDGWTPLYTARICGWREIELILERKRGLIYRADPLSLKIPSRWDPEDKHPGIKIDLDNPTALFTDGTNRYLNLTTARTPREMKQYGIVRTDLPMLPLLKGRVYYFEVTINAVGNAGGLAIGFCEDRARLNQMLGWGTADWGFHSDTGELHGHSWADGGIKYHLPYGEAGVTIGCGVNFANKTAFYTMNGVVIGKAFDTVGGKLYPAVSMNFRQPGWRISAVFPGKDGKLEDFVFKGDCEGKEAQNPPVVDKESKDDTSDEDASEY